MATHPDSHRWYTAADCAAMLLAMKHGDSWRAPCPVHRGDSTTALHIFESTDKYGNPKTVLYCHAHQCPRAAICAEMGIEVKNLYAIHPQYARETRHALRARSPRIDRLKSMDEPTPDEIAQILLEEMIVSDPEFIEECQPARQKMWQLAQASAVAREQLTKALWAAHINAPTFWRKLAAEAHERTGHE